VVQDGIHLLELLADLAQTGLEVSDLLATERVVAEIAAVSEGVLVPGRYTLPGLDENSEALGYAGCPVGDNRFVAVDRSARL
jgi:hypothetical protein